jgi:GNAT superfamily N-acetyltransferase
MQQPTSVQIEHIPLVMVRDHLSDLPAHAPPAGFSARFYRRGEESSWARVETAAGEFSSVERALEHFAREFGPYEDAMEERCVFAIDDRDGAPVGTATGWYNDERGAEWGRLHWVGVVPEHQGKGIGRALVGAALHRMAEHHTKAYLTTQTTSVAAVRIYLDVGFRPSIESARCRDGWRLMRSLLGHPALDAY